MTSCPRPRHSSMSRRWKRGSQKPGVPGIPTREALDEKNAPLRESAESRKKSARGGK